MISSASHTLDTTALQMGDSIFQHQQQSKGTLIMLAAGEAVFLRAEAETMLSKEGYEAGTPAYGREFARRYMPLNSFYTTVMESTHAFLTPQEHAEVVDFVSHELFFDHYDFHRVYGTSHTKALLQAHAEFVAVSEASKDPRFYADYLKLRMTRIKHQDAFDSVVNEWFTRPS